MTIGAEWTPSSRASRQAASTAVNPSEATQLRICTICRSPSSDPFSLRRIAAMDGGNAQSRKGAPLRSAPGLRARTGM